mmetsp:Transcript_124668/g.364099  ORF Transcript_124668/g.364099 Transcript_124668/m.364099 type:complete len:207 (+) Transcript_124668:1243-1863(+)
MDHLLGDILWWEPSSIIGECRCDCPFGALGMPSNGCHRLREDGLCLPSMPPRLHISRIVHTPGAAHCTDVSRDHLCRIRMPGPCCRYDRICPRQCGLLADAYDVHFNSLPASPEIALHARNCNVIHALVCCRNRTFPLHLPECNAADHNGAHCIRGPSTLLFSKHRGEESVSRRLCKPCLCHGLPDHQYEQTSPVGRFWLLQQGSL